MSWATTSRLGAVRRGALVSLLCQPALTCLALGATWIVDGPKHSNSLGEIVESASSGDTIYVSAGRYHESLALSDQSLTLIGRDGAALTVLDGESDPAPKGALISLTGRTGGHELTLHGITFTHGRGSPLRGGLAGGAIFVQSLGVPNRVVVEDCAFLDNGDGLSVTLGGAICVERGDLTVRRCDFVGNDAAEGGGIYTLTQGEVLVEDSAFVLAGGAGGNGKAISATARRCHAERCSVTSAGLMGYQGATSLLLEVGAARVAECSFIDASGELAAMITILGLEGTGVAPDLAFVSNRVFAGGRDAGAGPSVSIGSGTGKISSVRNTFVRSGVAVSAPAMEFHHNLVAGNYLILDANVLDGGCNVLWECEPYFPGGQPMSDSDRVVDPQLCDGGGAYGLVAQSSPCLLPQPEGGCGEVGCCGAGCIATPIERSTWGSIKARWGDR